MSTRISRPRITRSNSGNPLTLEQVKTGAPAVFQMSASPNTSSSYAYIPTITVLEKMMEAGYEIHEVAQSRPYKRENEPYVKHMVRLRLPVTTKKVGDVVPELVLVNAHNGTARYYLYGGLYRFVCSNGLMVGDTFASISVAHRGGDITRSRVLEGSYEIVNEQFPAILEARKKMQQVILDIKQQVALADKALSLRYPSLWKAFPAEKLLEIRREQDQGNDLWTVFNRIQENVIEGGFQSQSLLQRRTTVRPTERVEHRVRINRGLWDAAMELTK
jgi:hypothetical protein